MDRYLEYLETANTVFADQIKTADQKAAYVLTVVLALLVSSNEARGAFKLSAYIGKPVHMLLVSGTLSLALMVAFIAGIIVVLPRIRPGRSVLYWGAWPGAGQRLIEARDNDRVDFIFDQYFQSTQTLAAICLAKYRMLRLSFQALLVAAMAFGLLLVFA